MYVGSVAMKGKVDGIHLKKRNGGFWSWSEDDSSLALKKESSSRS